MSSARRPSLSIVRHWTRSRRAPLWGRNEHPRKRGAASSGDHRAVDERDERRPLHIPGRERGHQARHRRCGGRVLQGRRRRRERHPRSRQVTPLGSTHRPPAGLEEGHRHGGAGPAHREVLRGRGLAVPLKQYKATSPARRFRQSASFEELTKGKAPERRLLEPKRRQAGRNAQGRVTTRHRGGGEKRFYRKVDFKRDKDGVPARVLAIEYDPNRSARLALLVYRDGEKRYIIAPNELRVGDSVVSGPDAEARVGNCLPLEHIPTGTQIHGVELQPGRGAQMVRAAGGAAQLVAKEGEYAQIRLPSGGIRVAHVRSRATIGQLRNINHQNRKIGGAGHKRRMGWRPAGRGVVVVPRGPTPRGGAGESPPGGTGRTPVGKAAMGAQTH